MNRKPLFPPRGRGRLPGLVLALVWAGSWGWGAAAPAGAETGVVVEAVTPGRAGVEAGLAPGDVIRAWRRPARPPASPAPAGGDLPTIFAWWACEYEQGPRGPVRLEGSRDGTPRAWTLAPIDWGLTVRPELSAEVLAAYEAGARQIAAGDSDTGTAAWEALAETRAAAGDWATACWLHLRVAGVHVRARGWDAATAAHRRARDLGDAHDRPMAQVRVWEREGVAALRRQAVADAAAAFERVRDVAAAAWGDSLRLARAWYALGTVEWARQDLDAAVSAHRTALALRERFAPESLVCAKSWNYLGGIAISRDDLDGARHAFERALPIQEALAPDSVSHSNTLNNLGIVAWRLGDLAEAERRYRQALTIRKVLAPDGQEMAGSLNNLGLVATHRGDFAQAEMWYRRALALYERVEPGGRGVAHALMNLGVVALRRGDLDQAESWQRRSGEVYRGMASESLDLARIYLNLGLIASEREDLPQAETWYRRALAIQEREAPRTIHVSETLDNLGTVAFRRGDLAGAETWHQRSLAILERVAPAGHQIAITWYNLGGVAQARGDLDRAEACYRRALAVHETLAPHSAEQAEDLYALGIVARRRGQAAAALDFLARAVTAIESQVGRLGGTQETRASFQAGYRAYFREYLDLLLEQDRPAEAFHVLERSRARILLEMLAERDLVFTADLPPELEKARKRLAWEYDRTQERLAELPPGSEAEAAQALVRELGGLRNRQAAVAERIRRASPRLAALQYPAPLTVDGAREVLDPGTVLLSYSVGADRTDLFLVDRAGKLRVEPLPVGEEELRRQVTAYREGVRQYRGGRTARLAVVRGRRLYDLLIGPVEGAVERGRRLLLIPDGPLHALPFGALVRPGGAYLVEWKPVHVAVSATVYAELVRGRDQRPSRRPSGKVVAFGDPAYGSGEAGEGTKPVPTAGASPELRGPDLQPLPSTRREIAALGRLFGDHLESYLGAAATEERAKARSREARYLHFACHGLLDERFPLNSGLALAFPPEAGDGRDNGLLQAWEIFEGVRTAAELVTLSACETGLGQEAGGEGLIGLVRAFQYAGAGSVLASLWQVSGPATGALMERFYGYLKAGQPKDAALRAAQLDLIRKAPSVQDAGVDTAPPFFWAAFQLYGDWR